MSKISTLDKFLVNCNHIIFNDIPTFHKNPDPNPFNPGELSMGIANVASFTSISVGKTQSSCSSSSVNVASVKPEKFGTAPMFFSKEAFKIIHCLQAYLLRTR